MIKSINENRQQMLRPVDKFNGTVLVQGSNYSVLSDTWPSGINYCCGHCSRMVLVVGIADDQLWDIGFECFACRRLSVSPGLPPGMALPPTSVLVPEGRYRLDSMVDMRRAVLIGETAAARRLAEAGQKGATLGRNMIGVQSTLDVGLLRSWLQQLQELLGARYDKLYLSDTRARTSSTPPKYRHGLMVVVQSLKDALVSAETSGLTVDMGHVTEVHALLTILNRWKQHPLWPKLVAALDGEYEHTIITLAAATFLEDAGNGVVFHESPGNRAPDLLLVVGPQQRAAVEIKAPRTLCNRRADLTSGGAAEIIRSAMKKAGTGTKGQLAQTCSAFLVLGGFRLSQRDLDLLEQAARTYLDTAMRAGRHSHLIALAIVSLGSVFELSSAHQGTQTHISGVLAVRVAENPGYKGELMLRQEPVTPLNRIEDG